MSHVMIDLFQLVWCRKGEYGRADPDEVDQGGVEAVRKDRL